MDNLTSFQYADKYSFLAEWYNEVADLVKEFILSFYPNDGSLELYDRKCERIFLRRTKIEGITLLSLHVGAVLNIFSRHIKIVDYANAWTQNLYNDKLQTIFFLVKPNAICKLGALLSYLEKENFQISQLKMGTMTKAAVELISICTPEAPLQHEYIQSMTCGPSIAVEVIGEDALARWSEAAGGGCSTATPSPLEAALDTDCLNSHLHFSGSFEQRAKEAQFWFGNYGEQFVKNECKLSDSTCCIIKPHAVGDGLVGEIITYICESGFTIHAVEMMHLEKSAAEKFYEVYRGVVPEYASMVTQLVTGACIVMELSHTSDPASSATIFRQLAGPSDPTVAQQRQPNSIRAKFGKTIVQNAVHCTDLPDDAELEVEFFFKLLKL